MNPRQIFRGISDMFPKTPPFEYLFPSIALGVLFVIMSCATTEQQNGNYYSINEILPSESFTANGGPTDEIRVTGNGKTALFSPDVAGFAINGNWHELDQRPVMRNGKLYLSKSDASTLRGALSSTTASKTQHTTPTSPRPNSDFTVVIDPGHGGKFVGARGVDGKLEKELNLNVAQYAKRNLKGDVDVKLTRSSDHSLSSNHKQDLDQRVQFANRQNADLFISIHANAARSSSANGFELYVSPRADQHETIQRLKSWHPDPSSSTQSTGHQSYQKMYRAHRKKSYRLARLIRDRFKQVVPTGSRGIKTKSLHVLRNAPCPAVLVELGFMTNQREANLLDRTSYQHKLGQKIAQAVKSFRRSLAHRTSN